MKTRMLLAIVAVSVVSCLVQPVGADEKAEKWAKYFEGKWQRETKVWTDQDGWKAETVNWTGELAAGGTVNISKGTESWGDFVGVLGIDPQDQQLFEYGASANGNKWRTVYTTVEPDKLAGKLIASLGDGSRGDGQIEIVRTGDNTYETTWALKFVNGKEMKGVEKNKRR